MSFKDIYYKLVFIYLDKYLIFPEKFINRGYNFSKVSNLDLIININTNKSIGLYNISRSRLF
jgi:hypothetical protein